MGKEDCLFLDILTTAFYHNESNLAVMVWIHGGFFFSGDSHSSSYNLDYFVDEHIVSIKLNYRLGFLGFYHSKKIFGNMGIKDQLIALKWIKKNIKYFGGDPKKITIMGESAGAVCVSYLIQTPLSKGLFQRAIMQSGNTLTGWAIARKPSSITKMMLKLNKMLIKFVDKVSDGVSGFFSVFLPGLKMAFDTALDPLQGLLYAPVKEKENPTAIHLNDTYKILDKCENGSFVPIMIGFNKNEGRTITEHNIVTKFLSIVLNNIYSIFSSSLLPKDVQKLANCSDLGTEIKKYYKLSSYNDTAKFIGDVFFVEPTVQYVKMFSKCNKVYFYRFSYNDAGHGDDLYFLFANFFYKLITYKERLVSKKMVKIWSHFIKYGYPRKKNKSLTWPESAHDNNYVYMDISRKLSLTNLSSSPHSETLTFWKKIYKKCGLGHLKLFCLNYIFIFFEKDSLYFYESKRASNLTHQNEVRLVKQKITMTGLKFNQDTHHLDII
nr:liver carboxylesterase-like [Onthophagus taurus]